jgi:hypothetical protein
MGSTCTEVAGPRPMIDDRAESFGHLDIGIVSNLARSYVNLAEQKVMWAQQGEA